MNYSKMMRKLSAGSFLIFICSTAFMLSSCIYMKMDPPPDSDKTTTTNNNSCYLATASNMLAGAGYGNGQTVQQRAGDIYNQLISQFGIADPGWTDAAITWWLNSVNNTWANNPYTLVTVYGNKSPKLPWADPSGARYIGNELRRCLMMGLSLSWPTNAVDINGQPIIGSGGHAITAWGDNAGKGKLSNNPQNVRVADSDNETGGDVQNYRYDSYTNPNPGGANEGNGWYIDYDNNHPYIKHIVTLCPTDDPSDNKLTQIVVGSYKIHQAEQSNATDLHYVVGTDVRILTYKTSVNWAGDGPPNIQEIGTPRKSLSVDWNFTKLSIPYCSWITVTTEFVLPYWNGISYKDIYFTYPGLKKGKLFPGIEWRVETPEIAEAASIRNVTGGYLIGGFDVIDTATSRGRATVAEYRFVHQYSFNQSPEQHMFEMRGEPGLNITNFRFGHSYGYLDTAALWQFTDWMTQMPDTLYPMGGEPFKINIDWKGRLPYPEGEDIKGRIPEIEKKDLKSQ